MTRPPRPNWPKEHDDALDPLWLAGKSCTQIAVILNERFGASYSRCAIIGRVHRKGIKRPLETKEAMSRGGKAGRVKQRVERIAVRRPPPIVFVAETPKTETPFEDKPRPPTPTPRKAFQPLPGTNPRPWADVPKIGLCKWPIDVADFPAMACCEPTPEVYCSTHRAMSMNPVQPRPRDTHRLARLFR